MSCSPTIPLLQNPTQTLLLVAIETHNPLNVHSGVAMSYALNFPKCNETIYIKQRINYAVGKNISSGLYNFVYLTKRVNETQGGGWAIGPVNDAKTKMDINFEVKPGYINFFPIKFIYTIAQHPGGVGLQWTTEPITKDDKEKVLIDFRKNKNFNQWKVDL